jgi:hypothetical protein
MTYEEDMELYRQMHARYDQLVEPVRGEVAKSFYLRKRDFGEENGWGQSMQAALQEHGYLPLVPITDAGALEYEEAIAAQEAMDGLGS